jgi:(1->4)-alpha-D-glucan 1-alpha-D-glucosylmutase
MPAGAQRRMSDDERLRRLAGLAGVESHYWDIEGTRHETCPDTARRLLSALGFPADDDADLTSSLAALEEREWRSIVPPVMVLRQDQEPVVPVHLPIDAPPVTIAWRIILEDGTVRTGERPRRELALEERRSIQRRDAESLSLPVPRLPPGHHELWLDNVPGAPRMPLIVAPPRCYLPPQLAEGRKCWGLAAQLYTVRSALDWGVGDFTDLRLLAEWAAELGADALGLNPLHALFPSSPDNASPYSPSSRLFRNAIYLDITAIPDYANCVAMHQHTHTPAVTKALAAARSAPLVDYSTVSRLKFEALEQLYATFRDTCLAGDGDARTAAFLRFQSEGGQQLHQFALFQVLSEVFATNDWTQWRLPYRDPASEGVATFSRDHADRIAFFEYIQWQAELQLADAAKRATEAGMAIGLYGDVAVSVDPAGADHWSRQSIFAGAARIGAPPDPFNALGQEWGVVPMNPWTLREHAYADFIALLRANMRHVGALRIDHIMALQHSYWVPVGGAASAGAYVTYPFEDLIGILALESHRNACLVIGEALGTVPEGFRPRMALENILSYHVLYFEVEHDRQKRPAEYPVMAATCVSTHDLATLKGFWHGTDLEARRRLGLYRSPEEGSQAKDQRERDKWLLLRALAAEGMLPPGLDTDRLGDIDMTPALASAVHAYLARSSACLFMVQLDDLIGEEQQVNLPGTMSEYPNWRHRLSRSIELMIADPALRDMARTISRERVNVSRPLLQ